MWVKFNDQAPNDPEIDALSDGALRLWFTAICHAQAELTDGFIADAKVRRLTPNFKPGHLRELTAPTLNPAGPLFRKVAGGYAIRNFAKWNRTRAYWEDQAAKAAARKAKWKAEQQPEDDD